MPAWAWAWLNASKVLAAPQADTMNFRLEIPRRFELREPHSCARRFAARFAAESGTGRYSPLEVLSSLIGRRVPSGSTGEAFMPPSIGPLVALVLDRPGDARGFFAVLVGPARAFLRPAGAEGDLEDLERRHFRRALEEAAVGLRRHAEQGAEALAVEHHGVAQHVRRAGRGLGGDVVLADLEMLQARFLPHTAQYSSPERSTLSDTTVSGST